MLNNTDLSESEEPDDEQEIFQIIQNLSERKEKYKEIQKQISSTDVRQVSLTDPDTDL